MQLQTQDKTQIVLAAQAYAATHAMSQSDVATAAGISQAYLSKMWNMEYSSIVNNKEVPIGNKWFSSLAEFCGHSLQASYWGTVQTRQLLELIPLLIAAKDDAKVNVLISGTGLGKTYIVSQFMQKNPTHTYKITVSSVHKLPDILRELLHRLSIHTHGNSKASKLAAIIDKLKELHRNGHKPMIIIDEAENLELPVLKMLKGLYDGIIGLSSLVLIGTSQLIDNLDKLRHKNKAGMPQFYRRIKAGIRQINTKVDFAPFYTKHAIEKPLQKLLNGMCDNYGELADYLQPALKEAARIKQPLTENFFRLMYNLPNY